MKTKLFLFITAIFLLQANLFAQSQDFYLSNNDKQLQDFTKHNRYTLLTNNKIYLPQPSTLTHLVDSIYTWGWDSLTTAWDIASKDINFVYDSQQNLISYISQSWNGASWDNFNRYSYGYDGNNNNTSFLIQNWSGSTWVNSSQASYSYNANSLIIGQLNQSWNGSVWVNSYKSTYSYDANNNMISDLDQKWNGSTWINNDQSLFTYNANNLMTSQLGQDWNGSAWVNNFLTTYNYNANNLVATQLGQSWNGTAWVNANQFTFSYDANNHRTGDLDQNWSNSNWVNSSQSALTLDSNNFLTSIVNKSFNSTSLIVSAGDSVHFYFHTVLLGIDELNNSLNVSAFPNPSFGMIHIKSQVKISTVEIMNVLGERIYSTYQVSNNSTIDISSQPSGIYFLQIITPDGIVNKKIVKE